MFGTGQGDRCRDTPSRDLKSSGRGDPTSREVKEYIDNADLSELDSAKCRMDIIGNSYIFKLPHSNFIESDYVWLAYLSREQFENDRSLTLEAANLHSDWAPREHKDDSNNFVSVSTSTCIHARFEILNGYRTSKVIKSGIRLVYKRDIECSEDGVVPATDDGSILHQHHNCSTLPVTDNASNKSRHINMSYKLKVSYFRSYSDDALHCLIMGKERLLNHLCTIEGKNGFFYRGVGRDGKMF
ncbi:hypothetical protein Dsin_003625 [Dipteronia sinensis]|uniref:Uncharacterized protein n=1 Tax=Dipteronia sinensis TaxID=43782 RepID=A0AAE0EKU4_9ROSI|nr:hypothetical protein Dsin_003625 [Dipteronia sinensis]